MSVKNKRAFNDVLMPKRADFEPLVIDVALIIIIL